MIQPSLRWPFFRTSQCIFYSITLPLYLISTVPAALSGTVDQVIPINFGSIDLHPGGDTITIDARNGSASPQGSHSVVTGGSSGRITITSSGSEQATVTYPSSIQLNDTTHFITIDNIGTYSQYNGSIIDLSTPQTINIHMGGQLHLPSDTVHNNYHGFMVINITFHVL